MLLLAPSLSLFCFHRLPKLVLVILLHISFSLEFSFDLPVVSFVGMKYDIRKRGTSPCSCYLYLIVEFSMSSKIGIFGLSNFK